MNYHLQENLSEATKDAEVHENDKSALKQALTTLEAEKNGLAMDLGLIVKVTLWSLTLNYCLFELELLFSSQGPPMFWKYDFDFFFFQNKEEVNKELVISSSKIADLERELEEVRW